MPAKTHAATSGRSSKAQTTPSSIASLDDRFLISQVAAAYLRHIDRNGASELTHSRLENLMNETVIRFTFMIGNTGKLETRRPFQVEIDSAAIDWDTGKRIIRASSSPAKGIALSDNGIVIYTDHYPAATLEAFKARADKGTLTLGQIISTGLPEIDRIPIPAYADNPPEAIVPPDNVTFYIEQNNIPVSAFRPTLTPKKRRL